MPNVRFPCVDVSLRIEKNGYGTTGHNAISSSTLTAIKADAHTGKHVDVDVLYVINNPRLSAIEPGAFSGLAVDVQMEFRKNDAFRVLEAGAFRGLKVGDYMGFSDNKQLATMKAGAFTGLTVRKKLTISQNPSLATIESGAFTNAEVGQWLWIYENPMLTTIQPGAFKDLRLGNLLKIQRNDRLAKLDGGVFSGIIALGRKSYGQASGVGYFGEGDDQLLIEVRLTRKQPIAATPPIDDKTFAGTAASKVILTMDTTANCCELLWLRTSPLTSTSGELHQTPRLWNGQIPGPMHQRDIPTTKITCGKPSVDIATFFVKGKRSCCPEASKPLLLVGVAQCVASCPTLKHVRQGSICDRCRYRQSGLIDEQCLTCNKGPFACTKCTDRYYLKATEGCVKDCNTNYAGRPDLGFRNVDAGRTCERCVDTDNCNKCPANRSICTECTNGYHLLANGTCASYCESLSKLKVTCDGTGTTRVPSSDKDSDFLIRYAPKGGVKDASKGNAITGSQCAVKVARDTTGPAARLELSPNETHTRDSTALVLMSFDDARSPFVEGFVLDDLVIEYSSPTSAGSLATNSSVIKQITRQLLAQMTGQVVAYTQVAFQRDGTFTITLPASVSNDNSCNNNTASNTITVVHDTQPPSVAIAKQANVGPVDVVHITVSDTLSPVVMSAPGGLASSLLNLYPLGRTDAVPDAVLKPGACTATANTTVAGTEMVCRIELTHPSGKARLPYQLDVKDGAFADKAGNKSPLISGATFHCKSAPLGPNGRCILFEVAVDRTGPRVREGNLFTVPTNQTVYTVGKNYRIARRRLIKDGTMLSAGAFDDITYSISGAPDGWFVASDTGEVTGVFAAATPRDSPIKIVLIVTDGGGQTDVVDEYFFNVVEPPTFIPNVMPTRVAQDENGAEYTDPDVMAANNLVYFVGKTYRISPKQIKESGTQVSTGDFADIRYTIEVAGNSTGWLVDTKRGNIAGSFTTPGTEAISLIALDGSKRRHLVENYTFVIEQPSAFNVSSYRYYAPKNRTFAFGASDPISNDAKASRENQFPQSSIPSRAATIAGVRYYDMHLTNTHTGPSRQLVYFNTTLQLPPIRIIDPPVLYGSATYTITNAPKGFFIDPTSGEVLGRPITLGEETTAEVYAIKDGVQVLLERIHFKVVLPDTSADSNGPNKSPCQNGGVPDDTGNGGTRFDSKYTCKCSAKFKGDNCEIYTDCEPSEIATSNGCKECLSGSTPDKDQAQCIMPDGWACPEAAGCTCNITQPTHDEINITCPGQAQFHASATRGLQSLLPVHPAARSATLLTLVAVEPNKMPLLLQGLPTDIGRVELSATQVPPVAAEASTSNAVKCPTSSAALASCPLGNNAEMPVIGVCFGGDAPCGQGASSSVICPAGRFADLETGQCRECDVGGFYTNVPGRMGWGSHCGCFKCQNGTYSTDVGAVNPAHDCKVCPPGTQTDVSAEYRACPCLQDFSRTDRFGPCKSCSDVRGVVCKDDLRSLKEGFYWAFDSPAKRSEYERFACDLRLNDQYNRSLTRYDGTFPPVYECPTPSNCLGGVASLCAGGTTGPLCAVCDASSRYFKLNGECFGCPTHDGSVVMLILVALVFTAIVAWLLKKTAQSVPKATASVADATASSTAATSNSAFAGMTLVKIMISYSQVQSMLTEV